MLDDFPIQVPCQILHWGIEPQPPRVRCWDTYHYTTEDNLVAFSKDRLIRLKIHSDFTSSFTFE